MRGLRAQVYPVYMSSHSVLSSSCDKFGARLPSIHNLFLYKYSMDGSTITFVKSHLRNHIWKQTWHSSGTVLEGEYTKWLLTFAPIWLGWIFGILCKWVGEFWCVLNEWAMWRLVRIRRGGSSLRVRNICEVMFVYMNKLLLLRNKKLGIVIYRWDWWILNGWLVKWGSTRPLNLN